MDLRAAGYDLNIIDQQRGIEQLIADIDDNEPERMRSRALKRMRKMNETGFVEER